jgi:hypothetical protein
MAVYPLIKPPVELGPMSYSGEDEIDVLRRKKDVVYGNIKDLDFEYKMGKLGDLDYQRIRNELKLEAALLMENMDGAKKGKSPDEALENEIKARRSRNQVSAESLCPKCRTPISGTSKYCAECGCDLRG